MSCGNKVAYNTQLAIMDSPTEVGTSCGDIVVERVVCNNLRMYNSSEDDQYIAVFTFEDNCGLMGLLFNKVRLMRMDAPTFMFRSSASTTACYTQISAAHPVVIKSHHTCPALNGDGSIKIRRFTPGNYAMSSLMCHNPVMSTVVSVKFKNVYVAEKVSSYGVTNAVMHSGMEINSFSTMEVSHWPSM